MDFHQEQSCSRQALARLSLAEKEKDICSLQMAYKEQYGKHIGTYKDSNLEKLGSRQALALLSLAEKEQVLSL